MTLKGKGVSRASLYKHLTKVDCKWIDEMYNSTLYSKIIFTRLTANQIKQLYVYHSAYNESKDLPYYGIYKPLGISRSSYEKRLFTVEEIVRLLRSRAARLFKNRKLRWYLKMGVHHRKNIDFVNHPIVLRSVAGDGYEIIDGNRRLIAKSMRDGFSFKCLAYVLER